MTHRWLALVALLLPLGLLAGCGDDSSTASPGATVTVTETASASATASVSESVSESASVAPTTTTPPASVTTPTTCCSVPPTKEPAVDLGQPPRTYDDALAHFDAVGSEPLDLSRFETPSGNIYCVLEDDAIPPSCELGAGAIEDPDACPAGGPTDFVGRLEFTDGRATAICNTDTIRTPGPPILGYTAAARVPGGDVQCLSEQIGVTCINLRLTEGFFLRKGQYVIFNAG